MTIAKQTIVGDESSINLTFTRKEKDKRVKIKMEYLDSVGKRSTHNATLENVGKHPKEDRKRMTCEMRLLYLKVHSDEFSLTNPRPTVEKFEQDRQYRWWRSFDLPPDIFY